MTFVARIIFILIYYIEEYKKITYWNINASRYGKTTAKYNITIFSTINNLIANFDQVTSTQIGNCKLIDLKPLKM